MDVDPLKEQRESPGTIRNTTLVVFVGFRHRLARLGPETLPFLFQASHAAVAAPCFPPVASRGGLPVRQVIGVPPAHLPPPGLGSAVRVPRCPGAQMGRMSQACFVAGGALKVPC